MSQLVDPPMGPPSGDEDLPYRYLVREWRVGFVDYIRTCITTATTSLSGVAWMLDEDDMASDNATKVASQQSIKAYVDAEVAAGGKAGASAYKSASAQSITAATPVKVVLDVESWDLDSAFTSSTYTVKTAGRYLVLGSATFAVGADNDAIKSSIYKAGARVKRTQSRASGTSDHTIIAHGIIKCAVSDTIELWVENATNNDTIRSGADATFLDIEYLGT